MKKITYELDSLYGGEAYSKPDNIVETGQMEVDDAIAETLLQLKATLPEDAEGLTLEDIDAAIQSGHPELEPLHQELWAKAMELDINYWFDQPEDAWDVDVTKEFFVEDVENGLYTPEPDNAEEEGILDYVSCCCNYHGWIFSHEGEYRFIAERLGIDLDELLDNSEATYTITEIEE